MVRTSAGILMYRNPGGTLEVLLVHPGGPYFVRQDLGAWSIPKGEIEAGEDPLVAAQREFAEETGCTAHGAFIPLPPCRLKSGKTVMAWGVEGACDAATIQSNMFSMEWPRGSGRLQDFPEVDRAEWFAIPAALQKINIGQAPLLHALRAALAITR